jgi:hypothetical protein
VETVLPESLPLVRPSPPAHAVVRESAHESARPQTADLLSVPAPPPEVPSSRLHDEMVALVHLREVAAHDPVAAVALAAEDDARYGTDDVFGEEREAIAIVALGGCDRANEARTRGRAFLSLHPKSPFAARVRGVLTP